MNPSHASLERLLLREAVKEHMSDHMHHRLPEEACGVLIGHADEASRSITVTQFIPVKIQRNFRCILFIWTLFSGLAWYWLKKASSVCFTVTRIPRLTPRARICFSSNPSAGCSGCMLLLLLQFPAPPA